MQYTFTGDGTIMLNGQTLHVVFSITTTHDTSEVTNVGNSVFVLPVPEGSQLSIPGVGTAQFTNPNYIFMNQRAKILGITGFDPSGQEQYLLKLGVTSPAISTYDLRSPIGPTYGFNLLQGYDGPYATTAGDFGWYTLMSTKFEATVVPEPDIMVLCGVGLLSLLCIQRMQAKP